MRTITIPFKPRFDGPIADGTKTRTWRTRRYGNVMDEFERGGARYRLVRVERAAMGSVPVYFQAEGFSDVEDAIRTLTEIFPQAGYDPNRMGWAHWFMKVRG